VSERFVVLTGGPGGGKTTLLAALAARGHPVTDEAGRALIRAGVGNDDPEAFAEAILAWERRSYAWALTQPGTVFFDRGMPDVAGSWLALRGEVPAHVEAAIAECRYRSPVLVAPPWREIYVHDDERKHSWETAVATYEVMVEAYGRYGYHLVELPLAPVEERVAFVLERV
jgi:predicted ATPase